MNISNIASVPVVRFSDYFWSDWGLSFKAFQWELFCSAIFPWIHKHNHSTDDHNTLIYCTYSQSSCLCNSHMAEQQFVSWLNHPRLTADFLFWNRFLLLLVFFFLLAPYVIVLSLAPLDKNDFKTKPFTPWKWFQSPNQSRHEHKTEIATSVRLEKTMCNANEIKGKFKHAHSAR